MKAESSLYEILNNLKIFSKGTIYTREVVW